MWVVVTTHHDADEGDEEGEEEDEVAVGVEQPAVSPLAARPRGKDQRARLHQETPAGEGAWLGVKKKIHICRSVVQTLSGLSGEVASRV